MLDFLDGYVRVTVAILVCKYKLRSVFHDWSFLRIYACDIFEYSI